MREYDWDFEKMWWSEAADERRARLQGCHCTHACYLTKNIEYSMQGQLSLIKDL